MNLKKEVLKVLPDFYEHYLPSDIEDWESEEDFIFGTLEHEVDMYINYKDYCFNKKDKEKVSYINKTNLKSIEKILKKYLNNCNKKRKEEMKK